jgi:hypothetical protein
LAITITDLPGVLPMSLETIQRALGALKSAAFGGAGVFDCPVCGGAGDLYVSFHPSDNPNYLFNLCCFCDCGPVKVGEKILGGKVRLAEQPGLTPLKRPGRQRAQRPSR